MAKDFYDVYEEMGIEDGLWALYDDDAREIKIHFAGVHGHLKLISNPWSDNGPLLIEVMNSDGRPMAYFNSELNFEYLVNAIRRLLYQG